MIGINDEVLIETMKKAQIPGVSMAFVDNEGHISAKTAGKTDRHVMEPNTEVNSNTIFGAASLSKAVFSYLTLKLIEQEKISLNLDTPLHTFLPLKTFYQEALQQEMGDEEAQTSQAITTRMVLSHQTGIPINGAAKFDFKPGSEYGYSGIPLMYLQEIIETQTGKSLDVLAQEEIFKPLGMEHSSFLAPITPDDTEPKANAANSVHTTASDYAQLSTAWLNDPNPIMQEAFQPQVFMTHDRWANAMGVAQEDCSHVAWGLGLGLEVNDSGNAIRAFHTGDMNQWRGQVAMNLEDKTTMVYFANGIEHNNANGHVLSDLIIKPKVETPHAMNWFFKKFAFARTTEGDWKGNEAKEMQKVGDYLTTGIAPVSVTPLLTNKDIINNEITDKVSPLLIQISEMTNGAPLSKDQINQAFRLAIKEFLTQNPSIELSEIIFDANDATALKTNINEQLEFHRPGLSEVISNIDLTSVASDLNAEISKAVPHTNEVQDVEQQEHSHQTPFKITPKNPDEF